MTQKHWIADAINPASKGALHKALHVKQGQKIPEAKLRAAAHGNSVTAKRARLAITMRGFNHKKTMAGS